MPRISTATSLWTLCLLVGRPKGTPVCSPKPPPVQALPCPCMSPLPATRLMPSCDCWCSLWIARVLSNVCCALCKQLSMRLSCGHAAVLLQHTIATITTITGCTWAGTCAHHSHPCNPPLWHSCTLVIGWPFACGVSPSGFRPARSAIRE